MTTYVTEKECRAWAKALVGLMQWENVVAECLRVHYQLPETYLTSDECRKIENGANALFTEHGIHKQMFVFFRNFWMNKCVDIRCAQSCLVEALRKTKCEYFIPRVETALTDKPETSTVMPTVASISANTTASTGTGGKHINDLDVVVRKLLCVKMDQPHALGRDRNLLAQYLGFNSINILCFKNTNEILSTWGQEADSTIDKLYDILLNNVQRNDAARILTPYLTSKSPKIDTPPVQTTAKSVVTSGDNPIQNVGCESHPSIHLDPAHAESSKNFVVLREEPTKVDTKSVDVCTTAMTTPPKSDQSDEGRIPDTESNIPVKDATSMPVSANIVHKSGVDRTYDPKRIVLEDNTLCVYDVYIDIDFDNVRCDTMKDVVYKKGSRILEVTVWGKDGYDRDMKCVCRVQLGSTNTLLSVCYYSGEKMHSPHPDIPAENYYYNNGSFRKCMYDMGRLILEFGRDENGEYEIRGDKKVYK